MRPLAGRKTRALSISAAVAALSLLLGGCASDGSYVVEQSYPPPGYGGYPAVYGGAYYGHYDYYHDHDDDHHDDGHHDDHPDQPPGNRPPGERPDRPPTASQLPSGPSASQPSRPPSMSQLPSRGLPASAPRAMPASRGGRGGGRR